VDRAGLVNRVKIKLDEFTPEGVGLPFDEYIGPVLDECVRTIQEAAPLHLLTASPITGEISYESYKAYLPLPADFVRLYEIRFPLWKRSVRKAIKPEDPEFRIQENEYLSGGYARPVVSIVYKSNGPVLECSKVLENTVPDRKLYVAESKPESLNDDLSEPLTWLCASRIFTIMGYPDKAQLLQTQYVGSLSQLINS
jgi:hypothetical protein